MNESKVEATKRVREMQLLGMIIEESEVLKLDHTSIRRIGKYLVNLANNEHAIQVRNGAKTEINDRVDSLHKISQSNEPFVERLEQFRLELDLIRAAHVRWTEAVKTV